MKEFIKRTELLHLKLFALVSLVIGVIYFFSLDKTMLSGTVTDIQGKPAGNVILSTTAFEGSTVTRLDGDFHMSLVNGVTGREKIALTIKEKGLSLLEPILGKYIVRPEKIQLIVVKKGDYNAVFSPGNLENIFLTLIHNTMTSPIGSSQTYTSRQERIINDSAAEFDEYYGFKAGTSLAPLDELRLGLISENRTDNLNKEVDLIVSQYNDGAVGKRAVYTQKLALADTNYFNENYGSAASIYKEINEKWLTKETYGKDLFSIKLRQLNAELLYFSNGGIDSADVGVKNEYLLRLKDEYTELLDSRFISANVAARARIANNLAHLADLCTEVSLCDENKTAILKKAFDTLETVSMEKLFLVDKGLWFDINNAMLVIATKIATRSYECNSVDLQSVIDSASVGLKPPILSYASVVDLPLNLVNALTAQADCSTTSAAMIYDKAIVLLRDATSADGFQKFSNNLDKINAGSTYCGLYHRSASIKSRNAAIVASMKSISCYQDLLEGHSETIEANYNQWLKAELHTSLAYSYLSLGLFQDYPEKKRALDSAVRLFRIIKDAYESQGFECPAYIKNVEGYALLELSENKDFSKSQRQSLLKSARELITAAYNTQKENPSYIDSLAWVDYKSGKIRSAKQRLESALRDDRKVGINRTERQYISLHLLEIYIALGNEREALKLTKEIKESKPSIYQLEKLKEVLETKVNSK